MSDKADNKLDLKYRPQKFSQILGNSGVISLLLKRSRDKTLSQQSMLLGGPKGCGKTTIARLIVRATLCQKSGEDGEPCGSCMPCKSIINNSWGSHIFEIDAASQGSVDRVREIVRESDYESASGIDHIYIIDEAQRLTPQAQDAFLKVVEERRVILILCTTETHKMKGPLRSRLEEYPITPPTLQEVVNRLKFICEEETFEFESKALEIIAKMNSCCPRTSILSLEKARVLGPINASVIREFFHFDSYELIDKILFLIDSSPKSAFSHLDELAQIHSPTWIRDTIIEAIAGGMRVDIGAKSNFPVPLRFYQTRLHAWLDTAKDLGVIEKPTLADISSALLRAKLSRGEYQAPAGATEPPSLGSSALIAPQPVSPVTKPSEPKETPKKPREEPSLPKEGAKSIEMDGVRFSSDEVLTTLDSKVQSLKAIEIPSESDVPVVEFGKNYAPISEKEFIRGLTSRLRSAKT